MNNGKFGGSRILLCPHALLNDGLCDLTMQHGPAGVKELGRYLKHCLGYKGAHIYKHNYCSFRGRQIKIVNRNMVGGQATSAADSDNLGIEEANRIKE